MKSINISIFILFAILAFVTAKEAKARDYTATCADAVEPGYTTDCETISGKGLAYISCGLVRECRPDEELDGSCLQPPSVSYECKPIVDDLGHVRWSCTGSVGTDFRFKGSYSEDEFSDLATRCSKICNDCRSGWK